MLGLRTLILSMIVSFRCGTALADPTPFKLGLLTNVPEATGGVLSYDFGRFLTLQGTYSTPLPIKVEIGVPSKKLVSQGDFAIRSPYLNLPFDVDFGPQWSFGGLVHPFGGGFYLGLATAHRIVTVKSHIESPLIFEDSDSQMESNTSFGVDLRTRTQQDLLRASVGQRSTWGHVFIGWYAGAVKPVERAPLLKRGSACRIRTRPTAAPAARTTSKKRVWLRSRPSTKK